MTKILIVARRGRALEQRGSLGKILASAGKTPNAPVNIFRVRDSINIIYGYF
jgi:hypothetical protein